MRRHEGFKWDKTPESHEDEFGKSAPIGPVQKATGEGEEGESASARSLATLRSLR